MEREGERERTFLLVNLLFLIVEWRKAIERLRLNFQLEGNERHWRKPSPASHGRTIDIQRRVSQWISSLFSPCISVNITNVWSVWPRRGKWPIRIRINRRLQLGTRTNPAILIRLRSVSINISKDIPERRRLVDVVNAMLSWLNIPCWPLRIHFYAHLSFHK